MEEGAPILFGDLNKNICQECGLPLIIYSYEKIFINKDEEKIKIKLFCQNEEHKEIKEFNLEDYKLIINGSLDKICRCTLCNKILQDTNQIPYYCYTCQKIICSECLNDKHDKEHKNCFKFEELNNKCLKHSEQRNENDFYCLTCKKNMCQECLLNDLEHTRNHDVKKKNIIKNEINIIRNIENIKIEQEENQKKRYILTKQLENLENKIYFNEFLLSNQNNYYHLFLKDLNKIIIKENKFDNLNNKENNNNNNKDLTAINVIYYDQNIIFPGMDIINDCQTIQSSTKGTIILVNDLINLNLLLKNIKKNNMNSKFILIVNGSAADNVINYIKKSEYKSYFINACIYTSNLNKYSVIKNKHSDFVEKICIDCLEITTFVKNNFEKNKTKNEKFSINILINFNTYKQQYYLLHKELSTFYGDETSESFNSNISEINEFIQNLNLAKEKKDNIMSCFQNFCELQNKDYKKIIISYLKNDDFSKLFNSLLMKKDISDYKKIAYFAGNLMHSLVQYGKKEKKGINNEKSYYKGMQLNIIDLLEYLKNRNFNITFPYFFSMSDNNKFAEITSKRNLSEKERKEKEYYSVIMKIDYLYDSGYEPSIIDLKDLAQYPDEEEFILLPFTFLTLNTINIDSNKFIADIEMQIIGKKEILETKIKESKTLVFDKKNKIMIPS